MKQLEVGLYQEYFDTAEIDCIEQPIANFIGRHDKKGYLLYCLYVALCNNFQTVDLNKSYFDEKKDILSLLGYDYIRKDIDYDLNKLVSECIEQKKAVLFFTQRSYITYEKREDNIRDSVHMIMIIGYDDKDFLLLDNLYNDDINNIPFRYELRKIKVSRQEIIGIWMKSVEDKLRIKKRDKSLFVLSEKEKKQFDYQMFKNIINRFTYKSQFMSWIEKLGNESLFDEEYFEEVQSNYCKSFKIIFKIISELCPAIDKEMLVIGNEMYRNRLICINTLLRQEYKGKPRNKFVLNKYLEYENDNIEKIEKYIELMEF